VLAVLSSEALRSEMAAMQAAMNSRPFNLGGRAAFDTLMTRVRAALGKARTQSEELRLMLESSFRQLNTEFGFAFAMTPIPSLVPFTVELDRIEHNYGKYLGLGNALRMATPGFAEQFRRILLSKLRVVFENAAGEIELWSKGAQGQVDMQLHERRRGFTRRREALQRIQVAASELEQRIAEVQAQDDHLAEMLARLNSVADETITSAKRHGQQPMVPRIRLDTQAQQDAA
jgi:hypothetical protein